MSRTFVCMLVCVLLTSCGGADPAPRGDGLIYAYPVGGSSSAGAAGAIVASAGSAGHAVAPATGGAGASGGSTGGVVAVTGGTMPTGGTAGSAGSAGDLVEVGGTSGAGGVVAATGGTMPTGGTGGSVETGGTMPTGGTETGGDAGAAGATTADAGEAGAPATGGTETGGAPVGGTGGTGGTEHQKVVFVSVSSYQSPWVDTEEFPVGTDPVAAADVLCQREAEAGGLPGTFQAWLETDAVSAVDRLTGTGPWYRTDGMGPIFVDRAALSGNPAYAITRDPFGDERLDCVMWSGNPREGGSGFEGTCSDYTSTDIYTYSPSGHCTYRDLRWSDWEARGCYDTRHFYCFEQ